MSNRTLSLIIVLLIVTVVLLYVALQSPSRPSSTPQTSPSPIPTPAEQSILRLMPNPLTISSPSGQISVEVESGTNKITAVQLELSFDPTKVTGMTITPGPLLENPIVLFNSIDVKKGTASYALGISPTGAAKAGSGVVATIRVQTALRSNEQTTIEVLPKSLVTAEGINSSVLKTSLGTTILFTRPTTLPTQ